jgi:4-hydroxy-3-methylbut-2-enyl diphosphate reductase
MEILVAKNAGFCMGVRNAMEKVMKKLEESPDTKLYTYGPLIHNTQVVQHLEERGVMSIDDFKGKDGSTVFIRSHGVPPYTYKDMEEHGIDILDATCEKVKRLQIITNRRAKEGYDIIIIGDKNHAEIIGVLGFSNDRGYVVNSEEDINNLPKLGKVVVVAQTTQNVRKFEDLLTVLKEKFDVDRVYDTICDATHKSQREVLSLSEKVDAMIVIGGKHSSNTKRLAELSKSKNIPTFHIETKEELPFEEIRKFKKVGVTAGASTPDWLIEEVVESVKSLDKGNYIKKHELEDETQV